MQVLECAQMIIALICAGPPGGVPLPRGGSVAEKG